MKKGVRGGDPREVHCTGENTTLTDPTL